MTTRNRRKGQTMIYKTLYKKLKIESATRTPQHIGAVLTVIVLSVLQFTASDYSFGIFWSMYCLSFNLRLLITPLVSFGHCIVCPSIYGFWLLLWYLVVIVLSVLQFTASHYSFGIFWSLYCLSSFHLRLLITPLVSCGHCIVCPSIYCFWLLLWFLAVCVLLKIPKE
jgi:hypothetical protein